MHVFICNEESSKLPWSVVLFALGPALSTVVHSPLCPWLYTIRRQPKVV